MIQIIPAIDIINGKCVRLSQGNYNRCKIYRDNPLEVAKQFEDCGVKMLHLVDLDGAKGHVPENLSVLETIANKTGLKIEFGGGIKTIESLNSVLNAGASRVICGSVACTHPEQFIEWLQQFSGEKIVFGADLKDGIPAIHGWMETSESSFESLLEQFLQKGLQTAIITNIALDGMLQGPSTELYKKILDQFPALQLIASGGVSKIDDIIELDNINIPGVIVGKAIYEGKITLKELTEINQRYVC